MRYLLIAALMVWLGGCQNKPAEPESKAAPQPKASGAQAVAAEPAVSDGTPPDTILIASPYGNVTFTHAKHYERLKGDCSACHPKVFPQSRAPLNYKKALHRAAEASMTSCAHCHAVGGTSFAADSNCTKCHALKEYPRR
jgi:c(7)-type cytochrome triheme protein